MPGCSVDPEECGLISKNIPSAEGGGHWPTTACLHLQGGCSSMPAGPGRHPPPLAGQAKKDQSGGRASMPAALSHRQPGLDLGCQLQEDTFFKRSLHSHACMRPLGGCVLDGRPGKKRLEWACTYLQWHALPSPLPTVACTYLQWHALPSPLPAVACIYLLWHAPTCCGMHLPAVACTPLTPTCCGMHLPAVVGVSAGKG